LLVSILNLFNLKAFPPAVNSEFRNFATNRKGLKGPKSVNLFKSFLQTLHKCKAAVLGGPWSVDSHR
jgi:hypothetical protein